MLSSDKFIKLDDEQLTALQNYLRNIYRDIADVCHRHNLTLMLTYGTLIGAIRHKGIIPWDDDIDLMMPREDYVKFIDLFPSELSDKYHIVSPLTPGATKGMFVKIVDKKSVVKEISDIGASYPTGAFIDIFPLENMPEKGLGRRMKKIISTSLSGITGSVRMYKNRNEKFRAIMSASPSAKLNYNIRLTIGFIFSFYSHKKWAAIFDKFASSSKYTGLYHIPTAINSYKEFTEEMLFPVKEVDFHGLRAYAPNDHDSFLNLHYTDYMQIPPEEERERHLLVEYSLEEPTVKL